MAIGNDLYEWRAFVIAYEGDGEKEWIWDLLSKLTLKTGRSFYHCRLVWGFVCLFVYLCKQSLIQ